MSVGPEPDRAGPGSDGHACLVFDDERAYAQLAAAFLSEGEARHEKTVMFGPQNSRVHQELRQHAAVAADPYVDVLGCGELEPERMFAMFRQEAAMAREEGYDRLRVAADMDWLLPAIRSFDEALRFEILLDRFVSEIDATVLCAYRRSSFGPDTILGVLCTHPVTAGHSQQAPFKLIAGGEGCWVLSGELDVACAAVLVPALKATVGTPWVVDASGLAFADVCGMRAIATAAHDSAQTLHLRGASDRLQRYWRLAEFDGTGACVVFDC